MSRRNVVTVVAAFLAGILLTMGSMMYSRARQLEALKKVAETTPATQLSTPAENPENSDRADIAREALKLQRREDSRPAGMLPQLMKHAGSPRPPEPEEDSAQGDSPDFISHSLTRPVSQNVHNGSAPEFLAFAVPAPSVDFTGAATEPPSSAAPEASAEAAKPQTKWVTLPPGTPIVMRLGQPLTADRSSSGEMFSGTLDSRLVANGVPVAEKGSTVLGRIIRVKRSHLFSGSSDLSLVLTQITTKDGQSLGVQTSPWEERTANRRIEKRPSMAGFAGPASNVSGTTVLVKEKNVVLTAGMPITFQLAKPVTLAARTELIR